MALTDRKKAILRLKADGASDCRIARKLKVDAKNVTRSKKTALKKIEFASADLKFISELGLKK